MGQLVAHQALWAKKRSLEQVQGALVHYGEVDEWPGGRDCEVNGTPTKRLHASHPRRIPPPAPLHPTTSKGARVTDTPTSHIPPPPPFSRRANTPSQPRMKRLVQLMPKTLATAAVQIKPRLSANSARSSSARGSEAADAATTRAAGPAVASKRAVALLARARSEPMPAQPVSSVQARGGDADVAAAVTTSAAPDKSATDSKATARPPRKKASAVRQLYTMPSLTEQEQPGPDTAAAPPPAPSVSPATTPHHTSPVGSTTRPSRLATPPAASLPITTPPTAGTDEAAGRSSSPGFTHALVHLLQRQMQFNTPATTEPAPDNSPGSCGLGQLSLLCSPSRQLALVSPFQTQQLDSPDSSGSAEDEADVTAAAVAGGVHDADARGGHVGGAAECTDDDDSSRGPGDAEVQVVITGPAGVSGAAAVAATPAPGSAANPEADGSIAAPAPGSTGDPEADGNIAAVDDPAAGGEPAAAGDGNGAPLPVPALVSPPSRSTRNTHAGVHLLKAALRPRGVTGGRSDTSPRDTAAATHPAAGAATPSGAAVQQTGSVRAARLGVPAGQQCEQAGVVRHGSGSGGAGDDRPVAAASSQRDDTQASAQVQALLSPRKARRGSAAKGDRGAAAVPRSGAAAAAVTAEAGAGAAEAGAVTAEAGAVTAEAGAGAAEAGAGAGAPPVARASKVVSTPVAPVFIKAEEEAAILGPVLGVPGANELVVPGMATDTPAGAAGEQQQEQQQGGAGAQAAGAVEGEQLERCASIPPKVPRQPIFSTPTVHRPLRVFNESPFSRASPTTHKAASTSGPKPWLLPDPGPRQGGVAAATRQLEANSMTALWDVPTPGGAKPGQAAPLAWQAEESSLMEWAAAKCTHNSPFIVPEPRRSTAGAATAGAATGGSGGGGDAAGAAIAAGSAVPSAPADDTQVAVDAAPPQLPGNGGSGGEPGSAGSGGQPKRTSPTAPNSTSPTFTGIKALSASLSSPIGFPRMMRLKPLRTSPDQQADAWELFLKAQPALSGSAQKAARPMLTSSPTTSLPPEQPAPTVSVSVEPQPQTAAAVAVPVPEASTEVPPQQAMVAAPVPPPPAAAVDASTSAQVASTSRAALATAAKSSTKQAQPTEPKRKSGSRKSQAAAAKSQSSSSAAAAAAKSQSSAATTKSQSSSAAAAKSQSAAPKLKQSRLCFPKLNASRDPTPTKETAAAVAAGTSTALAEAAGTSTTLADAAPPPPPADVSLIAAVVEAPPPPPTAEPPAATDHQQQADSAPPSPPTAEAEAAPLAEPAGCDSQQQVDGTAATPATEDRPTSAAVIKPSPAAAPAAADHQQQADRTPSPPTSVNPTTTTTITTTATHNTSSNTVNTARLLSPVVVRHREAVGPDRGMPAASPMPGSAAAAGGGGGGGAAGAGHWRGAGAGGASLSLDATPPVGGGWRNKRRAALMLAAATSSDADKHTPGPTPTPGQATSTLAAAGGGGNAPGTPLMPPRTGNGTPYPTTTTAATAFPGRPCSSPAPMSSRHPVSNLQLPDSTPARDARGIDARGQGGASAGSVGGSVDADATDHHVSSNQMDIDVVVPANDSCRDVEMQAADGGYAADEQSLEPTQPINPDMIVVPVRHQGQQRLSQQAKQRSTLAMSCVSVDASSQVAVVEASPEGVHHTSDLGHLGSPGRRHFGQQHHSGRCGSPRAHPLLPQGASGAVACSSELSDDEGEEQEGPAPWKTHWVGERSTGAGTTSPHVTAIRLLSPEGSKGSRQLHSHATSPSPSPLRHHPSPGNAASPGTGMTSRMKRLLAPASRGSHVAWKPRGPATNRPGVKPSPSAAATAAYEHDEGPADEGHVLHVPRTVHLSKALPGLFRPKQPVTGAPWVPSCVLEQRSREAHHNWKLAEAWFTQGSRWAHMDMYGQDISGQSLAVRKGSAISCMSAYEDRYGPELSRALRQRLAAEWEQLVALRTSALQRTTLGTPETQAVQQQAGGDEAGSSGAVSDAGGVTGGSEAWQGCKAGRSLSVGAVTGGIVSDARGCEGPEAGISKSVGGMQAAAPVSILRPASNGAVSAKQERPSSRPRSVQFAANLELGSQTGYR